MTQTTETLETYNARFAPVGYDLLVKLIFVPVGGERRFRTQIVEQVGFSHGEQVLELGCGTGSFTRLLLDAGATVTSVDGSQRMIARASRRAKGARYLRRDLRELSTGEFKNFDTVFFGFVLHELTGDSRAILFDQALQMLTPGGRIVVADHAIPPAGRFAKIWRRLLLSLEPPTVRKVIEDGYRTELEQAGFEVTKTGAVAAGTTAFWVAKASTHTQSTERPSDN